MRDFSVVLDRCADRLAAGVAADAAVRLFHGRGHSYPGFDDLTVDFLGGRLLVSSFGEDAAGARALTLQLSERFPDILGAAVQLRRGRATVAEVLYGEIPDTLVIREAGLEFLVRPLRNQNIGLFLDMAPTRAWVRTHAGGRKVLNLFAYTCAFSVAAQAGGATHVVNNDMSKPSLDWGRENHARNGQDPRTVSMLAYNLFKSWWKVRKLGPYGLIIIDPPTFQKGSFDARRDYAAVLKRLPGFADGRADVLACLNSPFLDADFLESQMARRCPSCRFVGYLPVSEDFPDRQPERGLKIGHFRFDR
ncbi:MAG: class I SAM-dependent methyltransferase [Pseudomonadales bacterium]|nr:class I SAM-dependent methyltransferase [Pseudomonadales bacterium]